jgi:ferric-chelate reductase
MRFLTEGPYGHNAHSEMFESVLIIVGGTGFSARMPYIEEYLRRSKTSATSGHTHKSKTQHIHLVWACRNAAYIREVCKNELAPAFNKTDILMDFHTTDKNYSSATESDASIKSDKEYGITEKSTFSQDITISQGRPDISAIIQEAAEKHTSRTAPMGKLAVFVCGPAGMAGEARDSVGKALRSGYSDVEYFEESFGW